MTETTNLRQADAKVEVLGILSEKKLEEVTVDGKKIIRGDLVIQTGDINFITFSVYVSEKKNDGNENPAYKGMKTIMEEYKSVATAGREAATKVFVSEKSGQFRPNSYVGRDKQVSVSARFQSMFFNEYKGSLEDFEPYAKFEIEMVIASMVPETDKEGEETGRVVVKGWMPTYSGIEPVTLVATDETAGALLDDYAPNNTVKFFGDIVNSRAVIDETIPVKIGKPKVRKKTIYKNEMIITGASEPYGEDSDFPTPEPYDLEAVRKAITDREMKLDEEVKKAKEAEGKVNAPKARTGLPNF